MLPLSEGHIALRALQMAYAAYDARSRSDNNFRVAENPGTTPFNGHNTVHEYLDCSRCVAWRQLWWLMLVPERRYLRCASPEFK